VPGSGYMSLTHPCMLSDLKNLSLEWITFKGVRNTRVSHLGGTWSIFRSTRHTSASPTRRN